QLALRDLVDRRLVIQAFKKESYQIPDHFVDQRMQEIIRESFGGDRNTFVKTLEAQNYTLGEFKQKEMERMIVATRSSHNGKSKISTAAPRAHLPKRDRTSRRNYSKWKHRGYRNAGSPPFAQRLTSRLSKRIPLIAFRLL